MYLSTIELDTTWLKEKHYGKHRTIQIKFIFNSYKKNLPFTFKKLQSNWLATARAKSVFPVPRNDKQSPNLMESKTNFQKPLRM